jgi:hypothetical protein
MYHTHVFIYKDDWFWIRSVMEYFLNLSSHRMMFEVLEASDEYCYGKNRAKSQHSHVDHRYSSFWKLCTRLNLALIVCISTAAAYYEVVHLGTVTKDR